MKYKLSFCEIEQLSDDIFEVTINEGAEIDEKCAEDAQVFWHNLRKKPYNLLVNNNNSFSYSFLGAQKIGYHSLERKTAVLAGNNMSKVQIEIVLDLKEVAGNSENRKVFQDRAEAMKWLENP